MAPRAQWLLSVDPGEHSGWVLWQRLAGETWVMHHWGMLEDPRAPEVTELLAELQDITGSWVGCLFVVEGQYVGENPQSALELTARRCYWEAAAELAGCDMEFPVNPSRWISAMTKRASGKTTDERIEAACAVRWPRLELKGDVAAAALLGAWLIERRRGVACAPVSRRAA